MRALEKEAVRTNPLSGSNQMAGGGATPSMGLSEFRGGVRTGAYEGDGHCEEVRMEGGGALPPMVGAGHRDGAGKRSSAHLASRAAVVKKVMAEKGLKLIEASKYVKEHGLWKK